MLYMLLQKQSVEVALTPCTIESGAYTSAALLGSFQAKLIKVASGMLPLPAVQF